MGGGAGDSSGSSSGFSSDEDDALATPMGLEGGPSSVREVEVDVIAEPEASELDVSAASVAAVLADVASAVPGCCLEAARPLLDAASVSFHYEQYMSALAHLADHWASEENEEENEDEASGTGTAAAADFRRVRAAVYAQFHRAFPLTWEMFAQWIDDVRAVADKRRLFALAARDYWSVPLTLAHLRFLHEHEGEGGITRATVTEAMRAAQRSVGPHFAQGHEVWQLCREITAEQLDEDDRLDEDARALAKERALRGLFEAQMQLPLAENDLVMSEFRAWNTYNTLEPDEERRRAAFDAAEAAQTTTFAPLMKKLKGFEQAIASGSPDPAETERAWLQYIRFVAHRVAPLMPASATGSDAISGETLVVCLYERAVAALCLYPTIWAKYTEYVAATADSERLLQLCHRAVRNVSFDSSAWVELLLAMEQASSCSYAEIVLFVETDVLTRTNPVMMDQYHFLNVLLTFCDISRRHAGSSSPSGLYSLAAMESTVVTAFAVSGAFLVRVFPEFVQGAARLLEYQAKLWLHVDCGAAVKKQKWQAQWHQIMAIRGAEAEAWATYYQESARAAALGLLSTTEIRASVFEEGLKQVKDYPLSVADLWVAYEREHGDLEGFLRARRRRSALAAVAATTATTTTAEAASVSSSSAAGAKRKLSGADVVDSSSAKRSKHVHKDQQGLKHDSKGRKEQQKPSLKPAAKDMKLTARQFTNDNTLFVCNLSKEATEEDVKTLFADIPSLKDVRLVVKMRGDRAKSRGMAYVQFTDASGVEQGLSRDGQLVHGHPISVKQSEPPPDPSSSGDQQSASNKSQAGSAAAKVDKRDGTWKTDPRTIYVGGLNDSKAEGDAGVNVAGDEALAAAMTRAMEEAGAATSVVISQVCILKDKHGRPKNYGLVELGGADQMSTCLALLPHVQAVLGPNVTMKPSRFSIAEILEQQQQQQKASKGSSKSAGGRKPKPKGKQARLPDAVAHERPSQRLALPSKVLTMSTTSMSLMPRALRKKKESAERSADAGGAAKPMTNDDFRQLLMKK